MLSFRQDLLQRAWRPKGSEQMRYLRAVIFVYAVGMAPASALPMANPHMVSASEADQMIQVVKHVRHAAHHHSRAGNGVHPLVGSGDY
jgi:hypothetical protein